MSSVMGKFVNLLLITTIITPLVFGNPTITNAQDCVVIEKIGFNQPEPFTEGDSIRFGASIGNHCAQSQTVQVQCYLDGQLWDSGPVPVSRGQSMTIWVDNYWTATAGSHSITVSAEDSSLNRSFSVLPKGRGGGIPPPLTAFSVSTNKFTYSIGESIIIKISPAPAIGVKYWLIIHNPNGGESKIDLGPGTDTIPWPASNPAGQYKVEMWGQVVTYPQPSADLVAHCYFTVISNTTCSGIWEAGGLSGFNSRYEPGAGISGSINYKISNNSDSPGAIAQILVGIIDQNGNPYDVTCIYDGNPKTCTDYTSGSGNFNFIAPGTPGTYKLVAAMDRQTSCRNAVVNFPHQGDQVVLTNFDIDGETKKYTLTANVSPSNGGSINPGAETYDKGAKVSIKADPNSDWEFDHWGGDASGNNTTAIITMNTDKSVTAYFRVKQQPRTKYTLIIKTSGQGDTNPKVGRHTYDADESVSIEADPKSGWVFDHWEGIDSYDDNEAIINMNYNRTVTAIFVKSLPDLAITSFLLDPVHPIDGSIVKFNIQINYDDNYPEKDVEYEFKYGDYNVRKKASGNSIKFEMPQAHSGPATIILDPNNKIEEINEQNNIAVVTIKTNTKREIDQYVSKYFKIDDLRNYTWHRLKIYNAYGMNIYAINIGDKDKLQSADLSPLINLLIKLEHDSLMDQNGTTGEQLFYDAFMVSVGKVVVGLKDARKYAEAIKGWMDLIVGIGDAAIQEIARREGRYNNGQTVFNYFEQLADVEYFDPFNVIINWNHQSNGLISKEVLAWDQKDYGKVIQMLNNEAITIKSLLTEMSEWSLKEKLFPYTTKQKDAFISKKNEIIRYLETDLDYVEALRKFLTEGDDSKTLDIIFPD